MFYILGITLLSFIIYVVPKLAYGIFLFRVFSSIHCYFIIDHNPIFDSRAMYFAMI